MVFVFVTILALLPTVMAEACETTEYRPTALELKKDAAAFFEQEALIYEGIMLGRHDYDLGGRLLVLKSYKGSAKSFTILRLPPGSSCYSGISPFSVGFWSNYSTTPTSFDGFVSQEYVDSWRRQGLIDDGVLTPSRLVSGFPLLILALMILIVFRLRKRRQKSG